MDDQMIYFMPSQIALILGCSRVDVLSWIESGKLNARMKYKRYGSSISDIVAFLQEHPEEMGRIYCDDLIPFFNQARSEIIELLENLNEVSNLWQDCRLTKSQRS